MTQHLTVRVEPEAEANTVKDIGDGILQVTTTESASSGAANKSVVKIVRDYLETDRPIRIVSGHKQSNKILAIGK